MQSIYYNDLDNTFEDEEGNFIYDISGFLPNDKILEYKQVGGTYYSYVNGETIEIVFPIIDNYRLIAYYEKDNMFTDDNDNLIVNILSIVRPNDLLLFKQNRKSMLIKGIQGRTIDLLYVD